MKRILDEALFVMSCSSAPKKAIAVAVAYDKADRLGKTNNTKVWEKSLDRFARSMYDLNRTSQEIYGRPFILKALKNMQDKVELAEALDDLISKTIMYKEREKAAD